ncbi:hypothetical protein ACJIZ3_004348 [Penstemon smallii]|uniref:tricyclene synthase n=1 Tax=Penstemon smallii TaxID=265156 RepID=A0ABD3S209_9LAMI
MCLEFIGSNDWAVSDNDQVSPIGFDIIFPMMINYASELDLALPIKAGLVDLMLRNRDSDIKRRNQNLDYVAEGIGESFDWNKAFSTQQRSNGSLFNSPATTAAALIHCHNDKCLEYLHMVLKEFKTWVPAIYPMDIYTRLRMVDILESLGVDHYFRYELNNILEETYRLWKEKDEEILEDITCRAIAFRLLRIKGYEVSPDELGESVFDQEQFFETVSMQMNGVNAVLELYRASQFRFPEEDEGTTLGKINVWTSTFLKQQLLEQTIVDKQLQKQVEYDLKNFHGTLDRVGNRQALELYDIDRCEILKTAYRCPSINNEDFLQLSRKNFNVCQAQHQKELQQLERWYAECRLDSLKLGRDVLRVSHFLTCAILPDTNLSDARMSYAKTITLVTCVDDLFDHYGSRAESLEILELIKGWNDPSEMSSTYGSQEVEIIFKALYSTVNELAAKASIEQGRCVKKNLINLWVEIVTSFMREMDSSSDETAPTLDEYLSFAWVSIGCRICSLTSIHFLGIKLSEDIFTSPECTNLCQHVSLVARLRNDLQTFKREQDEKKLNSVNLQTAHGAVSEEEAISNLTQMVEYNRQKLLQLVFQTQGIIPRECKDVFWKTCKISYYLYSESDEFTSPQQMKEDIKSLIYQPLI